MITKIAAKKLEIQQCYLNDRREHAETYEKDKLRGLSQCKSTTSWRKDYTGSPCHIT